MKNSTQNVLKSPTVPQAPQAPQGVRLLRSPDFRQVYASAFGFKVSPTDFCLTIVNATTVQAPSMQEETSVMMALPQLKILSEALSHIVNGIEKEFGPIRVPSKSKLSEEQITRLLEPVHNANLTD
jgi:hypothetical protein